jgi:uncharacterized protein
MRTFEVDYEGRLPIDGFAPGGFRVAGVVHAGPLALTPDGIVPWDGLPDRGPVLERAEAFDVLLVGTGAAMMPPPDFAAARARFSAGRTGAEFMSTPSACRTYNVLLAEGRRVAAALMPV